MYFRDCKNMYFWKKNLINFLFRVQISSVAHLSFCFEQTSYRTFHRCFLQNFSFDSFGRQTLSDGKSSHCLWQGELKRPRNNSNTSIYLLMLRNLYSQLWIEIISSNQLHINHGQHPAKQIWTCKMIFNLKWILYYGFFFILIYV
jgi:hypothetical protein